MVAGSNPFGLPLDINHTDNNIIVDSATGRTKLNLCSVASCVTFELAIVRPMTTMHHTNQQVILISTLSSPIAKKGLTSAKRPR